MQKLVRATVLLGMILSLIGCVQQAGPRQIAISDEIGFDLLPPQSYGKDRRFTELAEITVANEVHEMLLVSEISSEVIVIVALMPNGTRLFTMRYDGSSIASDGYDGLLDRIQPAYFLADFQISRWPFEIVRDRFIESASCFREGRCVFVESEDKLGRRLDAGGRRIIEISYGGIPHEAHSVRFTQFFRDYRIELYPAQ